MKTLAEIHGFPMHEVQCCYCRKKFVAHYLVNGKATCSRGQNIYSEKGHPVAERMRHGRVCLDLTKDVPGISVEKASKELICGCPFCCASFDD